MKLMIVNERELIMYPTVSIVGIEDRKEYTRIQAVRNEIVCRVCGMKYNRKVYKVCPLCESRKKNSELESYINNINTEKANFSGSFDKVDKCDMQGKDSSKSDPCNVTQERKLKTNDSVERQNDARQARAYNAVIMECAAKINQDDYVTDGYVSDLLKKNKIYNSEISIAEVRKDVAEYMRINKGIEGLGKGGSDTSVNNIVRDNKTERYSKKLSVNEIKKGIDYKIVVMRAYFKENEDGSVSDDFIRSELDNMGLNEKCSGKINIEDVRNDMRLIKEQQADKEAISEKTSLEKNKHDDSVKSETVSQMKVKEKEGEKQEVNKKTSKGEKKKRIIVATETIIIIAAAVFSYFMFYSSYIEPEALVFLPKWTWLTMWIIELIVVPLCVAYMVESNEVGLSVIYMCVQIIMFYIAEVINGGPCNSVIVFIRLVVGALLEWGAFAAVDFRLKHSKVKK